MIPGRKAMIRSGLAAIVTAALVFLVRIAAPGPVELRAGYNSYIPFVMAGPDGGPKGFAVEIVTEAAKRARVKLRWIPSDESVDDALREGKIDFFPMLTLTRERIAEFHVSEPWWENETAL